MENYYTSSTLLFPLAALSLVSCNSQKKEEVRQPNIIFMMTDDHTTQAMSCYGGNLIQTPNMDRIANEGIRFDNCYAVNALSGPSRACILTGKFSHENGFTDNASTFNGDQQTFPKLLQQAGYQTAMIGKWHLTSDPTGFDYWNILVGQGDYYNPIFIDNGENVRSKGTPRTSRPIWLLIGWTINETRASLSASCCTIRPRTVLGCPIPATCVFTMM